MGRLFHFYVAHVQEVLLPTRRHWCTMAIALTSAETSNLLVIELVFQLLVVC